jgi:hypothetical protein
MWMGFRIPFIQVMVDRRRHHDPSSSDVPPWTIGFSRIEFSVSWACVGRVAMLDAHVGSPFAVSSMYRPALPATSTAGR